MSGTHFEAEIHIVEKNSLSPNKWAIINGGHRWLALKDALRKKPDLEIIVDAKVYDKIYMYPEHYLKVYDIISKGTPEGSEDYLKKHIVMQYPPATYLLAQLPVTVDRDEEPNKVRLKWLLDCHYMYQKTKETEFPGGVSKKPEKYVETLSNLTMSEATRLITVFNILKNTYFDGREFTAKQRPFNSTNTFYCLFIIVAVNLDKLSRKYIEKRLREKLPVSYLKTIKLSGITGTKDTYHDFISMLNQRVGDDKKFNRK